VADQLTAAFTEITKTYESCEDRPRWSAGAFPAKYLQQTLNSFYKMCEHHHVSLNTMVH